MLLCMLFDWLARGSKLITTFLYLDSLTFQKLAFIFFSFGILNRSVPKVDWGDKVFEAQAVSEESWLFKI